MASLLVSPSLALAAPAEGELPSIDFPAGDTTAQKGEWILTVNKAMYDDFAAAPDKKGVTFYSYELFEAGPKISKFKSFGKEVTVPNLLVVPLPKGGKAKAGDILLTWWQSGSGMQRAIVMSAKDPTKPVVRYLDIDYDNPATGGKDGKTPIGQMEEELKADTFVKLDKPWQAGTTVACKSADGKSWTVENLIRVGGDKVLLAGFMGKLSARAKADCKPMPQKASFKKGQKVQAQWVTSVKPATVTKVDAKIGRVWVTFDGMGKDEKALAVGLVIDKL